MFNDKYSTNTNYNNPYAAIHERPLTGGGMNLDSTSIQESEQFSEWRRKKMKPLGKIVFFLIAAIAVCMALTIMYITSGVKNDTGDSPLLFLVVFMGIFTVFLITPMKLFFELIRGTVHDPESSRIIEKSPEFSKNNRYYIKVETSSGEERISLDRDTHRRLNQNEYVSVFNLGGKTLYALPIGISADYGYAGNGIQNNIDIVNLPYYAVWKRSQLTIGIIFIVFTIIILLGWFSTVQVEGFQPIYIPIVLFMSLFTLPYFLSKKQIRKIEAGEFKYMAVGVVTDKDIVVKGTGKDRKTEYWITGQTSDRAVQAEISLSLYRTVQQGSEMVFFSLSGDRLIAFPLI